MRPVHPYITGTEHVGFLRRGRTEGVIISCMAAVLRTVDPRASLQ